MHFLDYVFLAFVIYIIYNLYIQNNQIKVSSKINNNNEIYRFSNYKNDSIISEIRQRNQDKYIPKTLTGNISTCNIGDLNCKVYNNRDINSACDALCDPMIYTKNFTKIPNKELSCECSKSIETFTTKLTLNKRSQLEESDLQRQSKLIFGI